MKNLIFLISSTLCVLTVFSTPRLYHSKIFETYIDADTLSRKLIIYSYSRNALNTHAICSLNHLADSFYLINYSPEEHGFANVQTFIKEDSSLNGHTRFTIIAPMLKKCYPVVPSLNTYITKSNFGESEIADGYWTKILSSSQVLNDTIYGFSFLIPKDSFCNMMGQSAYKFYLPNPIILSNGNLDVVIRMPYLSDTMFQQYSIRDNIIILTDSILRWENLIFNRIPRHQ